MPSEPLHRRVARDIQTRMNAGHLDALPPVRDLARELAVSESSVRKALGILAHQGVVDCARGRRARRAGSPHPTPAVEQRLFDTVRARILDGTYRVGHPLPKVNYFAVEDRVSPNTVAAACARLAREGLIGKSGKQWIVGGRSAVAASQGRDLLRDRSTALLLFRFGAELNPFFMHAWIAQFSAPFTWELQQHRWVTALAFMDRSGDSFESAALPIPAGTSEVVSHARQLAERYRGALVYYGVAPPAETYECLRAVMGLGKPVVYFDHNDGHPELSEEFASRQRNLFYRCHLNETGAIDLALQTLADLGHRTVGVPFYCSEKSDWIPRRIERVKQRAQQQCPGTEILTADMQESFWRLEAEFDLSRYADQVRAAVDPARQKEHGRAIASASFSTLLRAHTHSIAGLLDRGATAILCLNDAIAREVYLWTRYAGIRVPDDLTLLSFDNSVDCRSYPVSTIDFGLSRLGYLAAHVLIGDIPVKTDGAGNIPGVCEVVHRGSLGVR